MAQKATPSDYVHELKDLGKRAPKLFGVPTCTKLDEMFFKIVYDEKKKQYVREPLGGLPSYSVINVTGIADTGKSLLAEQFALVQASLGYKVLFVTVETPAQFLYTAFKERASFLNVDFSEIEKNIIVLDASQSFELRDNLKAFLDTMKYAIEKKSATITVIDSVTGLYEHREMLARQIVRDIYNFLKRWHQTALLISQKRSSQGSETAEAAGGLAVAHIVDGTIVLAKKLIETKWDVTAYGMPLGSVLRTIRIDGCRLCAHDSRTFVFDIDERGLINIKMTLDEFVKRGGKHGSNK